MKVPGQTKQCPTCWNDRELSEFSVDKDKADGLRRVCKKCDAFQRKVRRQKKAEHKALLGVKCDGIIADELEDLPVLDVTWLDPEYVDEVLTDEEVLREQAQAHNDAVWRQYQASLDTLTSPDVISSARRFLADTEGLFSERRKKDYVDWCTKAADRNQVLRKVLLIPDCHVPFEDKRAFDLMLQVARAWKPDEINVMGDFSDFYSVSSHDKRPDRVRLLDVEVAAVLDRRKELDALGATKKRFILGNHEDRLERYLMTKAPELFNLVRVVDLFKLKENGWEVTPYKKAVQTGKLNLTHDCGNAGPQAHMKALSVFQGNVAIGHTHRLAVSYEGNAQGDSHVGAMLGWLGDKSEIDYMHETNVQRGWQLGFGIAHQQENGVTHLQPIPIVGYKCVVDGVLYVG